MSPPPPPAAPPQPTLPPLRPPLPSLFLHRQTQQQRGASDEIHVPPLQWRSEARETELLGNLDGTEAIAKVAPAHHHGAVDEPAFIQTHKKRLREVVTGSGHESEASCPTLDDPSKAKKPAYLLQRRERQELIDEARALAAQIEKLRRGAGLPTNKDKTTLKKDESSNGDIEETLRRNHLYLGRLHSMVTNELLLPAVNTMSTFIHLPKDLAQRRAILHGMQHAKLRRGIEVAMDRLRHLDHTIPYKTEERFVGVTGEYHWHHFAIHQFPNFKTVRQLYDANARLLHNLDLDLTELVRQVTLCEDTDDFDPTIWNHRIITVAEDVGCTEELNFVGFAKYYTHSKYTNSPLGVIVHDTVNIDDLYPYVPEERTCKDYQAVSIMYEVRKPGTNETVVVLKYCAFAVQLVPQFRLSAGALTQLQENTSRWPNAIMKHLHEYVVTEDSTSEC